MPAGRPEFKPTAAMREEVEIMVAARISEADIAKKLRIDPKTLRKHFSVELTEGFIKRNAELTIRCYRAAMSEKATVADKRLWREIVASNAPTENEGTTVAPAAPLGKKEQRIANAENAGAGNDWGVLITPPPVSH